MPTLRYYVGSGTGGPAATGRPNLLSPDENAVLASTSPLELRWTQVEGVSLYRIELTDTADSLLMSAIVLPGVAVYSAPSWLKDRLGDGRLQWRVVGLDKSGKQLSESPTRRLRINK